MIEVNPIARAETLNFIREEIWALHSPHETPDPFTLKEYLKKRHHHPTKEEESIQRARLRRLVKNGWLGSYQSEEGLTFRINKKFFNYLKAYGSFLAGPLVNKEREKEIQYVEKLKEKVIEEIILGEK